MATQPTPAQSAAVLSDAQYHALQSRDSRFDGLFFVGVISTRIYCRPICRVRVPKQSNCRFFELAAQAESQGFRPCLRCRPELAPSAHNKNWSTEDASQLLAHQAAALITQRVQNQTPSRVDDVAVQIGVSPRHLGRILQTQLGVTPLQLIQTQRLLCAKNLLTSTELPVSAVALHSGFGSTRSFNAAFEKHYRMPPLRLRKASIPSPKHTLSQLRLNLGYRPPYQIERLVDFFRIRQLAGVEYVGDAALAGLDGLLPHAPLLARTLSLPHGSGNSTGWATAQFDAERSVLRIWASNNLAAVLPSLVLRLRTAFDLDAQPDAIAATLGKPFEAAHGLRIPGAWGGGFELAVRAILGQQVTVAAGRTFTQRVVEAFGETIDTPWPQLNRCFPTPQTLAAALPETLGSLGIVKQRQTALIMLAQAVADGRLALSSNASNQHTNPSPTVHTAQTVQDLQKIPGIGRWTAQYIALRALRDPDAFPAGDVALHHAMGLRAIVNPSKRELAAQSASDKWRPWRGYATLALWAGLWDGPECSPAYPPSPTDLAGRFLG